MRCPPEIADVLLEIIGCGILSARAAAWGGDAARCAIEADHIHNLPNLIANFDAARLRYYWEVERVGYINRTGAENTTYFDQLWQRLRPSVERATSMIA